MKNNDLNLMIEQAKMDMILKMVGLKEGDLLYDLSVILVRKGVSADIVAETFRELATLVGDKETKAPKKEQQEEDTKSFSFLLNYKPLDTGMGS